MSPENREKLDLAVVEIWKNVPFRIYDIVDGWVKPPLIGRYAIIDENTAVLCIMGEIAKRIKNKWMHWSANGLENLLNLLLVRYCNKERYNKIKQKYLNHKHTFIHER